MRKKEEIVLQYSGTERFYGYPGRFYARPPEITKEDVEYMRVILRQKNGKEKILFTGRNFSEEEWKKRMKMKKEARNE